LQGAPLKTHGDHRVAMALAIAGLCADGGVQLDDGDCADISFRGFFDLLQEIGG
jgi:3-phosphoshikimate 1-carboxyvinyltransferase